MIDTDWQRAFTASLLLGLFVLVLTATSQPQEPVDPWPQVCRVVHPEDLDR